MPLEKGKSKKVFTYNLREMMESPTFAPGKSPQKRDQMALAAAYREQKESGNSKKKARKKKKKLRQLW